VIRVDHRSRVDCMRVRFAQDRGGQELVVKMSSSVVNSS